MSQDKIKVIYDGNCVMCNWSARLIKRFDKSNRFALLSNDNENLKQLKYLSRETIILLQEKMVYTHSTAILLIARKLNFPLNVLYLFIIVPKPIRDSIYKFVAKNRQQWFGSPSCSLH